MKKPGKESAKQPPPKRRMPPIVIPKDAWDEWDGMSSGLQQAAQWWESHPCEEVPEQLANDLEKIAGDLAELSIRPNSPEQCEIPEEPGSGTEEDFDLPHENA